MACTCGGQHKTASGCAGARFLSSRPKAFFQRAGREGGKTNAIVDRDAILDRYRHLDRDDAILSAWSDSRSAWRHKRYRMNQRNRLARTPEEPGYGHGV